MSETINPEFVCYRHPNRETRLRCNNCDRLICAECAVKTPTGYRCKECVRGFQKKFDTAKPQDYVLGVVIAAVLAYLGGLIAQYFGFFIIFIAPAIGIGIAELVRRAVKRRRSKRLFQAITGAAIVGALAQALPFFLLSNFNLFALLWPGVYVFFMVSSLYYRLSGIQIR